MSDEGTRPVSKVNTRSIGRFGKMEIGSFNNAKSGMVIGCNS